MLVAFLLALAVGGPMVPAVAGDTDVAPVIFSADGDEISGWWWLRDAEGRQRAAWRAFGTPTPVSDVTLELELLATDAVDGGPGVDARFYLTVGALVGDALADAVLGPELTQLENVSLLDDPVGYTNRGNVVIPAGLLPADSDGVWVFIERLGPDGSVVSEHIAVNSGSVRVFGLAQPPGGPPDGTPTIVALGDSFISGEAGRWAGNTEWSYTTVDALGGTAYDDVPGGEAIPGCHRSRSAEVHIGANEYGPDVETINLACSGAVTETRVSGDSYKPGIDRCPDEAYCPDSVHQGQVTMLEEVARTHNVDLVVLSIGGNDFEFSKTVEQCAKDFMFSPYINQDYCYDDGSVTARFSEQNVYLVRQRLVLAYQDIIAAMTDAGYYASDWTLLVQTYPSPLAPDIRYVEMGTVRFARGGCPFWDEDADWANGEVMDIINGTIRDAVAELDMPNVGILDVRNLLVGHRLCEDTVDTVGGPLSDVARWSDADAADLSEWVAQIRAIFSQGGMLELTNSVYQKVESFHPNYWGQMALRSCLRQAYNNGNIRGGTCQFQQNGLNDRDEPQVILMQTCTSCGV
jgi:hypothetical protein